MTNGDVLSIVFALPRCRCLRCNDAPATRGPRFPGGVEAWWCDQHGNPTDEDVPYAAPLRRVLVELAADLVPPQQR